MEGSKSKISIKEEIKSPTIVPLIDNKISVVLRQQIPVVKKQLRNI